MHRSKVTSLRMIDTSTGPVRGENILGSCGDRHAQRGQGEKTRKDGTSPILRHHHFPKNLWSYERELNARTLYARTGPLKVKQAVRAIPDRMPQYRAANQTS